MNKQKFHTYRSDTLALTSLKLVLTSARKDLPPHVAKKDRNEELALKLIKKIRTSYKKHLRFIA